MRYFLLGIRKQWKQLLTSVEEDHPDAFVKQSAFPGDSKSTPLFLLHMI